MASLETLGTLLRCLNGAISQQIFNENLKARINFLGRGVKVRGFRPGKTPFKILHQQFGAQAKQDVLKELLQNSFTQEVSALGLRVAGRANFELMAASPEDEQIQYRASFEVFPQVVIGEVSSEQIVHLTYTLSDADVEKSITTLREQRTVFELVERPAQNGDRVSVDFSGTLDGVAFEGGEARDFSVILGKGLLLPNFESAIIGMSAKESKSFDMTFPENYHGKEVAGKQVTFELTLKSVEEGSVPELSEEFAKTLGIGDGDISKLQAEIRDTLVRETGHRLKVMNKNNVMDVLLKVCPMEVPKALLEAELQNLMEKALQEMHDRGVVIPEGMSLKPDPYIERAEKRVKLGLILAEFVKQHQLGAKSDQIKALVQEYAQSFENPEEVVAWHYSDSSRLHEAEAMVLEDNVVNWVMRRANVTEKSIEFNELMGNK